MNKPVKIAFDAATSCGVCYGIPFEKPTCLTWDLGIGLENGQRGLTLMRRATALLDRLIKDHGVEEAFIEHPMKNFQSFQKNKRAENPNTAILLNGFVFMLQTVCFSRQIPVTMYERQEVLKHFTGQPRYRNTEDGKRACARIAQLLGYNCQNWDEADAAALWDLGCAKSNPRAYALAGVERPALPRSTPCPPSKSSGKRSTAPRRRQATLRFT